MYFTWPEKALEVTVRVKTDDEILQLREKVAELEEKVQEERAMRDRAEFRYRCECVVNAELVDLCHASNVDIRPALKERPW